jgi:hypothetical protein
VKSHNLKLNNRTQFKLSSSPETVLRIEAQDLPGETGRHDISWYPIQWAIEVIRQARVDGEIIADIYTR